MSDRLTLNHLRQLIAWHQELKGEDRSPLSPEEEASLASIDQYIQDEGHLTYEQPSIAPRIVRKLLRVEGASEYLNGTYLELDRLVASGRWSGRSVFDPMPTYFYPQAPLPNQSSPEQQEYLDVEVGDMIRVHENRYQTYIAGKIVHVTEEGVYIQFRENYGPMNPQATLFYSHADLNERLPANWEIVRPFATDKSGDRNRFPKVPSRAAVAEAESRMAATSKQKRDSRIETLENLEAKRDALIAKRDQLLAQHAAWLEMARQKISFGKYLYGYWEFCFGDIKNVADIRHLPFVWGFEQREWDEKIRKVNLEIVEVEKAIQEFSIQEHGQSISASRSAAVSEIVETSFADSVDEVLDAKLSALETYQEKGELEEALSVAVGGIWAYRLMSITPLGSVEQTLDNKRSLTSKINELIDRGLIDFDGPILTADDLSAAKQAIAAYNRQARKHNRLSQSIVSYSERDLISTKALKAEVARLRFIDAMNQSSLQKLEMLKEKVDQIESQLGREKVWAFTRSFGLGCIDVLNDPATMAMVVAGAGAGAIGRAVMVRLAAAGLNATSTALIGLALEGVIFHNVSNAMNYVVDPFELGEHLDWGIGGNLHSIFTLGWLKVAGKLHGRLAEATYFRLAKNNPNLFKVIFHAGGFGTEAGAFAAQGVFEKNIIGDAELTWEGLADELSHSTQMVIAFRAFRAFETTTRGKKSEKKSVATEALDRVNDDIAKLNARQKELKSEENVRGDSPVWQGQLKDVEQGLQNLFLRQLKLMDQVYSELLTNLRQAWKMGKITEAEYREKRESVEGTQQTLRMMRAALNALAKEKGLEAEEVAVERESKRDQVREIERREEATPVEKPHREESVEPISDASARNAASLARLSELSSLRPLSEKEVAALEQQIGNWRELPADQVDVAFKIVQAQLERAPIELQAKLLTALYPLIDRANNQQIVDLLPALVLINPTASKELLNSHLQLLSIALPRLGQEIPMEIIYRLIDLVATSDVESAKQLLGFVKLNFIDWSTLGKEKVIAIVNRLLALASHVEASIANGALNVLDANWEHIAYETQKIILERLVEINIADADMKRATTQGKLIRKLSNLLKPPEAEELLQVYFKALASGELKGFKHKKVLTIEKLIRLTGDQADANRIRYLELVSRLEPELQEYALNQMEASVHPDSLAKPDFLNKLIDLFGGTENFPVLKTLLDCIYNLLPKVGDLPEALQERLIQFNEKIWRLENSGGNQGVRTRPKLDLILSLSRANQIQIIKKYFDFLFEYHQMQGFNSNNFLFQELDETVLRETALYLKEKFESAPMEIKRELYNKVNQVVEQHLGEALNVSSELTREVTMKDKVSQFIQSYRDRDSEMYAELKRRSASEDFSERQFVAAVLIDDSSVNRVSTWERFEVATSLFHRDRDAQNDKFLLALELSLNFADKTAPSERIARFYLEAANSVQQQALLRHVDLFITDLPQDVQGVVLQRAVDRALSDPVHYASMLETFAGNAIVDKLSLDQKMAIIKAGIQWPDKMLKRAGSFFDLLREIPSAERLSCLEQLVDKLVAEGIWFYYQSFLRGISIMLNRFSGEEEYRYALLILKLLKQERPILSDRPRHGGGVVYKSTIKALWGTMINALDTVDPAYLAELLHATLDFLKDKPDYLMTEQLNKAFAPLLSAQTETADRSRLFTAFLKWMQMIEPFLSPDFGALWVAADKRLAASPRPQEFLGHLQNTLAAFFIDSKLWTGLSSAERKALVPMLSRLVVASGEMKNNFAAETILPAMVKADAATQAAFKTEFMTAFGKMSEEGKTHVWISLVKVIKESDAGKGFIDLLWAAGVKLQDRERFFQSLVGIFQSGRQGPVLGQVARLYLMKHFHQFSPLRRMQALQVLTALATAKDKEIASFLEKNFFATLEMLDVANESHTHMAVSLYEQIVKAVQEKRISQPHDFGNLIERLAVSANSIARFIWGSQFRASRLKVKDPKVVEDFLKIQDVAAYLVVEGILKDPSAHPHSGRLVELAESFVLRPIEAASLPPSARHSLMCSRARIALGKIEGFKITDEMRQRAIEGVLAARLDNDQGNRKNAIQQIKELVTADLLSLAHKQELLKDLHLLLSDSHAEIRADALEIFKTLIQKEGVNFAAHAVAVLMNRFGQMSVASRVEVARIMREVLNDRIDLANEGMARKIITASAKIPDGVKAELLSVLDRTNLDVASSRDKIRAFIKMLYLWHQEPAYMEVFTGYFAPGKIPEARKTAKKYLSAIFKLSDLLGYLTPSIAIHYLGEIIRGNMEPAAARDHIVDKLTAELGLKLQLSPTDRARFKESLSKNTDAWFNRNFLNYLLIMSNYLIPEGMKALKELIVLVANAPVKKGAFQMDARYEHLYKYFEREVVDRYKTNWEKDLGEMSAGEREQGISEGQRSNLSQHIGYEMQEGQSVQEFSSLFNRRLQEAGQSAGEYQKTIDAFSKVLAEIARGKVPDLKELAEVIESLTALPIGEAMKIDVDEVTNDLRNILEANQNGGNGKSHNVAVKITNDPTIQLRMGIEPQISCQRVHEQTGYNTRGELLSRLLYGQFKLAQIYIGGVLKGRTVLELARHEDGSPVLLVELLYDKQSLSNEQKQAFADAIREYAQEHLGLKSEDVIFSSSFDGKGTSDSRYEGVAMVPREFGVYRDTYAPERRLEPLAKKED